MKRAKTFFHIITCFDEEFYSRIALLQKRDNIFRFVDRFVDIQSSEVVLLNNGIPTIPLEHSGVTVVSSPANIGRNWGASYSLVRGMRRFLESSCVDYFVTVDDFKLFKSLFSKVDEDHTHDVFVTRWRSETDHFSDSNLYDSFLFVRNNRLFVLGFADALDSYYQRGEYFTESVFTRALKEAAVTQGAAVNADSVIGTRLHRNYAVLSDEERRAVTRKFDWLCQATGFDWAPYEKMGFEDNRPAPSGSDVNPNPS